MYMHIQSWLLQTIEHLHFTHKDNHAYRYSIVPNKSIPSKYRDALTYHPIQLFKLLFAPGLFALHIKHSNKTCVKLTFQ